MNKLIKNIFNDFQVDGEKIPVSFLRYKGKSDTFITYQQIYINNSFSGDDEIIGYIDYYDFDIYSKGNFLKVVESVKKIMKQAGFMWQPSKSSSDMFEDDTGYYHKTLCFAIEREENYNG